MEKGIHPYQLTRSFLEHRGKNYDYAAIIPKRPTYL